VKTGNYVRTGEGPFLKNAFFERDSLRTHFKLEVNQGFDWIFKYGDRVGMDIISQRLLKIKHNETPPLLNATVEDSQISFFMFAEVKPDQKEVRIGTKANYTEELPAGNYTLPITLFNFLGQSLKTNIVIELVPVEKLKEIVQPVVAKSVFAGLKSISFSDSGLIHIAFSNYMRNLQEIQPSDKTDSSVRMELSLSSGLPFTYNVTK
jgi:hypothetical protein